MWAFISPCAFSNAVLQMQAFNAWQSPNILAHKWGGGGGPPLGGVQSAAHRRCAVRAGSPAKSSSAKCQDQSQMANLKSQAHSARLRSYTPLFFSPQEGWDDRNPVTKFAPSAFSGLLNRFFCSSRVCFKNDFEKTSKKLRKSWILASQNFPKIHPKCLPNRCFKKHAIFH